MGHIVVEDTLGHPVGRGISAINTNHVSEVTVRRKPLYWHHTYEIDPAHIEWYLYTDAFGSSIERDPFDALVVTFTFNGAGEGSPRTLQLYHTDAEHALREYCEKTGVWGESLARLTQYLSEPVPRQESSYPEGPLGDYLIVTQAIERAFPQFIRDDDIAEPEIYARAVSYAGEVFQELRKSLLWARETITARMHYPGEVENSIDAVLEMIPSDDSDEE